MIIIPLLFLIADDLSYIIHKSFSRCRVEILFTSPSLLASCHGLSSDIAKVGRVNI